MNHLPFGSSVAFNALYFVRIASCSSLRSSKRSNSVVPVSWTLFLYATGLPPDLTSRFPPGTLISSYEVFEAVRHGIVMPFRKRGAEAVRNTCDLRASDK